MSSQIEQFTDHPIFQLLKDISSNLNKLTGKISANSSLILIADRAKQVTLITISILDSTDPNLVPISLLTEIQTYINSINTNIINYIEGENESELEQIDSHLDHWLTRVTSVYAPRDTENVEGIASAITSLRRSLGQHARHLRGEVSDQEAAVSELETKVVEIGKHIVDIEANFQTTLATQEEKFMHSISSFEESVQSLNKQFDTAQSSRTDEFNQSENSHSSTFEENQKSMLTQFQDLTKQFQDQFSEENSSREKRFGSEKDALNKTVEKIISSLNTQIDANKNKFATLYSETDKSLSSQLNQAKEIVGIIANTGLAGAYRGVANKADTKSFLWNILTVISMFGLIGFAVWAFIFTKSNVTFTWPLFFGRIWVSLTFGLLAGYSAAQAHRNSQSSKLNRRIELELSSIDSYLGTLPDELRDMLKAGLADKYFGHFDSVKSGDSDEDAKPATSLLELVIKFFAAAAKNVDTAT